MVTTVGSEEASLLGTELEIVASFDIAELRSHFKAGTSVVRDSFEDGVSTMWLQLAPTENDFDEAVRRFAAMVDGMPPALQAMWTACADRCLNTGVQSGSTPHAFPIQVASSTLAELVRASLRLQFTVYAPDQTDRTGSRQ